VVLKVVRPSSEADKIRMTTKPMFFFFSIKNNPDISEYKDNLLELY